ncbi:MAG: amidase [Alphaproteobacteria bacterium]
MAITTDPFNAFLDYGDVAVPRASKGPLSGLTFAVKDIYDVAGYPTGCGNPLRLQQSPIHDRNAPAVQRLLDAGAECVGKTQTDELAFSLNGQNRHFPQPVNPRATDRLTGGSSSGSAAAVAGQLCDFALGSDTGGSIRAPASYCGLWGLRPTHGRIPINMTMPLAPSFDAVGWFADDGAIFARVGAIMLGEDRKDFYFKRLLRAADTFELLPTEQEAKALQTASEPVVAVLGAAADINASAAGLDPCYLAFRHLQAHEAWQAHGAWIEKYQPEMMPSVRERFEFGRSVTNEDLARANSVRVVLRSRMDVLLGEDGLMIVPTVPSAAPRHDDVEKTLQANRERALCILSIAGLCGLPQITLPLARIDNCPFGLSLIGPRGSDRSLVAFATGQPVH